MAAVMPRVYSPREAAELSGVSVEVLSREILTHRYPYIALKPGARPGDRAKNRWGLTVEQLSAIVEGLKVHPPTPEAEKLRAMAAAATSWTPPGGKSRVKKKPGLM
mgnify:CR=1 FL=1